MKFIVYLDAVELMICMPESEMDMVELMFGEQGSLRPPRREYKRVEIDADCLIGGAYGPEATQKSGLRLGIEGNRSMDLFLAERPVSLQ